MKGHCRVCLLQESLCRFAFKPIANLCRRIMACQAHEICIGGIDLQACGIGVVVEKLMQPEFHHEPAQAFGRRRGNLRLGSSASSINL